MPKENVYIYGDSDRITQVIVNLLSNAVKFTNTEGGIVDVILTHENNKAIIKVLDNGKGIPPSK